MLFGVSIGVFVERCSETYNRRKLQTVKSGGKMHQDKFIRNKTLLRGALSVLVCLTTFAVSVSSAEERHEDHEALRALLKQSVGALNSGNIESLRAFAIPNVLVTTAEQHRSKNFDEFKNYYDGLFKGP